MCSVKYCLNLCVKYCVKYCCVINVCSIVCEVLFMKYCVKSVMTYFPFQTVGSAIIFFQHETFFIVQHITQIKLLYMELAIMLGPTNGWFSPNKMAWLKLSWYEDYFSGPFANLLQLLIVQSINVLIRIFKFLLCFIHL